MKSDGINKKNRFYTVIHAVFAGLMRLIFRVEVINPENEPTDGRGMIVCCNHLSNADVVILVASMKNQVHFLAKSELFKIPLLGAFIRAIGAYPIKRGAADVGAIKKTIELADDGYTVGFFPQGTRKPGVMPERSSARSGIGMIAMHTKADILPVALVSKNFHIRPFRKNKLVIGSPVSHESIVALAGVRKRSAYEQYNIINGEIFNSVVELAKKNIF